MITDVRQLVNKLIDDDFLWLMLVNSLVDMINYGLTG